MKKFYQLLLVIACFVPLYSFSQSSGQKAVATTAQLQQRAGYIAPPVAPEEIRSQRAKPTAVLLPSPTGKIASVNPLQLGSASNVFSITRTESNQVLSIDSLDLVAFIHRSDATIFGGSSGHLRYDLSIDGGASFTNDIGVLNPLLTSPARFPNIAGLNLPGGNVNPLNADFVFTGSLVNGGASAFDGLIVGTSDIVTTGAPTVNEHYLFQGQQSLIAGGLCQSAPGRYWMTDFQSSTGSTATGNVFVYRGDYNTTTHDVDWVRNDTIPSNNSISFNGDAHLVGPNIAFSPDGQTGWVAWLGDLVGGPDSTYLPIFSKSSDCGQTWGAAVEVNLNAIPWIKDSLQSLWVDSLGNPASDGRASCAFNYDITVDGSGNPHLIVVICTGIDYFVSSGLAKFIVDVTSPDGGATWTATYLSPVLTFRTIAFGSTTTVAMDNYPQIARDEGGCNIFYSWVDSDTAQITGNGNGIGFGESQNLAPNLRIAAKNVASGEQTYPQLVSDLDLLWDGAMLFPTMAPIVKSNGSGWNLPIVAAAMSGNDPINPATFWYFGNDAVIPNSGWCAPASMTLGWSFFGSNTFVTPCSGAPVAFCNAPVNGPCVPLATESALANGVALADAFPNPSLGQTRISFTLPSVLDARLSLHNALGQEVAVLVDGEFAAGSHAVDVQTAGLAGGLYFYRLVTGETQVTKRLVVSH